jgi:Tfp pilus assembly protein PilN
MNEALLSPNAWPVLGMAAMFICVAVITVGCTLSVQWRKARQTEFECVLKKEMIERGMSADDILKVLQATSIPSNDVAAQLASHGLDADDIVKVLQASSKPLQRTQSA